MHPDEQAKYQDKTTCCPKGTHGKVKGKSQDCPARAEVMPPDYDVGTEGVLPVVSNLSEASFSHSYHLSSGDWYPAVEPRGTR